MIEVTACLLRGPVFLAGETIECRITFTNIDHDSHVTSQSSEVQEYLAWASAQIHCQCSVSEAKVKYPYSGARTPDETAISNTDTSFAPCIGERGHVVLSTKPKILFCDLRLLSGESKSFVYKEILPSEAPPTYKGQAVKYSYKITIGTQRINSQIKLLRVPIRVLVLYGIVDSSLYTESEDVTPSNPFLETQQKENPMDLALEILQNATARRSPSFYNITNNRGKVVRFCLYKPSFKLGEDIVGTFDFTEATIPCVQFSVTLQSEEKICEECQQKPNQMSTVSSYNKYHEVCINMQQTQMVLPIPLFITPGFQTDIVSLQWKLHFEFVTSIDPIVKQSPPEEGEESRWQGPSNLNIETMVWDLPVKIYPTNPLHVSQGLQTQTRHTISM